VLLISVAERPSSRICRCAPGKEPSVPMDNRLGESQGLSESGSEEKTKWHLPEIDSVLSTKT
jgi:hypothetical protein